LFQTKRDAPARVFLLDPAILVERRRAAAEDPDLEAAIAALTERADALLDARPPSVMDKHEVPPSGDRHDYLSLAPYWWPDPDSPDGLPYVRRDGERNPEASSIPDKPSLQWLLPSVHTLALAYFFSGLEPFAAKATELLRAWFLAPETAMNPHLDFGQGVRGVTHGRPEGAIDVRGFVELVDAIGLLEGSGSWTATDQRGLVDWFGRYLDWLLTSELGRQEAAKANNHGTWYVAQASAIALLVSREDVAGNLLAGMRERIAAQIGPDGSQPAELVRTRSLHYSLFNLEAHLAAADLARTAGIDLWGYRAPGGAGIRTALDHLVPYLTRQAVWPHPQIDDSPWDGAAAGLLHRAAIRCRSATYARAAAALRPSGQSGLDSLLHGAAPYRRAG
jgi:hypothetical protein